MAAISIVLVTRKMDDQSPRLGSGALCWVDWYCVMGRENRIRELEEVRVFVLLMDVGERLVQYM